MPRVYLAVIECSVGSSFVGLHIVASLVALRSRSKPCCNEVHGAENLLCYKRDFVKTAVMGFLHTAVETEKTRRFEIKQFCYTEDFQTRLKKGSTGQYL